MKNIIKVIKLLLIIFKLERKINFIKQNNFYNKYE
jgi:hypothetical protein